MICNMNCFDCVYPDCINDTVRVSSWQTKTEEQRTMYRVNNRIRQKLLYYKRKDEGLCVYCGVKYATNGVLCLECYAGRRNRREKQRVYINKHREWKEAGLCYFCGGSLMKGQNVCEKHYSGRTHDEKGMQDMRQGI